MLWKPLCDTVPGETVRIRELCSKSGIRRRLLDMGLTEGSFAVCLYRSPAGDPTAYSVRGAVIALRREDAATIMVSAK
ncbi:MAG: ferrous iron transport protein A [Clostridia bacterium]|nr:ferrous iron transport protein A [Clostridia bacterium]